MTQNIKKERTQEKTKSKKITKEDRETLTKYSLMPVNLEYIADLIGKNKGAVSREYRRVGMNRITYDAVKAQDDADQKRKIPRKENIIKTESDIEKVIIEKLKIRWSPEEIAEHCKTLNMKVSHETIYKFIYVQCKGTLKKELISYLRRKKRQRQNRKASKETRGSIPNMVSIRERPLEIDSRMIPGHWESDLIMGEDNRSAIGTLVERTTRKVILVPLLNGKDTESVVKAFEEELKKYPKELVLSMTHDRGKEMTKHETLTQNLGIKIYFCDPHSPYHWR